MKLLITTIIATLLIIGQLKAQETKTVYYNSDWKVVTKNDLYSYYRVVQIDSYGNPTGIIYTYYKSGSLQWKGKFKSNNIECTSCEECLCDGVCTWYHENGKKSSETNYRSGQVIGEEKNWDKDGNPRNLKAEVAALIGSEEILKMLIKSNITNNTYNKIQGIWDVEQTTQLFVNKEILNSKRSSSESAIVFLNGDYKTFTVNKGSSSMSFFPTYDENTFEVTIKDSGFTHKGTAKIISDTYMKVVIEGNKSFIRNKYGDETARMTDIFFEMNFRKSFPLKRDFETILDEITKNAPSTGSGFAIGSNYVVTNFHVVEEAKSIRIRGVNGDFSTSFDAHVVKSDPSSDLAILQIDFPLSITDIPYSLKSQLSEVGEDIYVLGYPLTASMGEEIKLTTGIISSQTGFQGSISQYQVSAPIQPGNSGSPLLDKNGYLIGVVSSKHLDTENVSYVVKSTYLRNLLDLLPDFNSPTNTLKGASLSDQVKKVKKYVYLIEINHD